MIRVLCKWMWRSWFPACFAEHLCENRLARTAIGIFKLCTEIASEIIQAINYFNKKYVSCLLVPVAVKSGAKDLAAGCWDRGFESCFVPSRHWLKSNDIPEKASLCPPSCSARLPFRLPAIARLRFASTLNLRGRKFAALNTAFLFSR